VNICKIKTKPRTGPGGGVRITLTMDLDELLLGMLSRGSIEDVADLVKAQTSALMQAIAKAANREDE